MTLVLQYLNAEENHIVVWNAAFQTFYERLETNIDIHTFNLSVVGMYDHLYRMCPV